MYGCEDQCGDLLAVDLEKSKMVGQKKGEI